MANWIGVARTNYFRVKDDDAFCAEMENFGGVEVWTQPNDPKLFGLGFEEGFWPSAYYDSENDDGTDVDFVGIVGSHLEPGQIAVFQVAGSEKLRYITGYAVAVNHEGKTVEINIDDIYRLAEKAFGSEPSLAQY